MKKSNIAGTVVLVVAVVTPSALIAAPDDEVTIRVMEMHEKSTASVMNRIQLPEAASDKVTEEANYRKRLTERKGETAETGLGDTDWDRIREQERSFDKEQERELDLVQDQIRDTEPDLDNGQQTGNEAGAGAGAK